MTALCKISACTAESSLAGLQWWYLFCPDKPHFFIVVICGFLSEGHCLHLPFVSSLLFYISSFAYYWMFTGLMLCFFHSSLPQYVTSEVDGPGKRLYPCFLAVLFLFEADYNWSWGRRLGFTNCLILSILLPNWLILVLRISLFLFLK